MKVHCMRGLDWREGHILYTRFVPFEGKQRCSHLLLLKLHFLLTESDLGKVRRKEWAPGREGGRKKSTKTLWHHLLQDELVNSAMGLWLGWHSTWNWGSRSLSDMHTRPTSIVVKSGARSNTCRMLMEHNAVAVVPQSKSKESFSFWRGRKNLGVGVTAVARVGDKIKPDWRKIPWSNRSTCSWEIFLYPAEIYQMKAWMTGL